MRATAALDDARAQERGNPWTAGRLLTIMEGMARPKLYARRDLVDLPPQGPSSWTTCSLAEMGEEALADVLLAASEGDPFETSTPESARADLREMVEYADEVFDPVRWLVVADDDGPFGVVLPQVYPDDPTTGTLFYLGVLPHRRGQGLGRALHVFGLHRLRSAGAQHYLGSTDAENEPMLAIFRANGCTLSTASRPA